MNKNPTEADLRKFGWAMLIGFGMIGLILWFLQWRTAPELGVLHWTGTGRQIAAVCLWILGAALWVLAFASLRATRTIYVAWMSVAVPIGIAVSTVMLTLLFFLLLPVFAIVVKLGDPLRKKRSQRDSYWEEHAPFEPTLERVRRLF